MAPKSGGRVVGGGGARRSPRGRARPCSSPPRRSGLWRPRRRLRSRPAGGRCGSPRARSGAGRASAAAPRRAGRRAAPPARRRARSASSPGCDDRVDGEEGALAAAAERELRQDQRARRERGPGRGGAALGVEGEAAEPDRPGAGGQPARLVEDRVAARCAGTRAATSAKRALAARGRLVGDAEPGQREPAVRLLPAEPAVRGQPRGEDRRAGIGEIDLDGDADQRPPPPRRRPWRASASEGVSRCHGRSRSRRCGPFRPGRAGGPSARRPRSCRPSRSPRSSSCGARRRRSWPGRSPRTG